MIDNFYKNKKVFITGHTGFKGSWLCKVLLALGAEVYGYSSEPDEGQPLFEISGVEKNITNTYSDIRDLASLEKSMKDAHPDIVIHMAAQPIVREGYRSPVYTYETNVMGTVNILEAVRRCESVRSVVNVTTDKVYFNREDDKGYTENDVLNGIDPYSNSKSCSELVTFSYKRSFLNDRAVSTCRAGNVIGGGDFAADRIIPDCYRAVREGKKIILRNPASVRPYQHVLDPLAAYLQVAKAQYLDKENAEGSYNIGPDKSDNITTGELAGLFCKAWGNGASWVCECEQNAVYESKLLYLSCDKIKKVLGWSPVWGINTAVEKTVEWYRCFNEKDNIILCMENQINDFFKAVQI